MNISHPEYFPPLNISHPLMFSIPPLNVSHPWIYPTMNVSHILIFLTPEYFSPENISHLNISHPILPLQPLLPLPGFTHDSIWTFCKCYNARSFLARYIHTRVFFKLPPWVWCFGAGHRAAVSGTKKQGGETDPSVHLVVPTHAFIGEPTPTW